MSTPNPSAPKKRSQHRGTPIRGLRVDLDLWNQMADRARDDGLNRNAAIVALMHGYVSGTIRLPKP